jgi:DNA-binding NtrC family response regulator
MLYNYYTKENEMKKICLLTKDAVLEKELATVIPKGFKVVKGRSETKGNFIFIDIDSFKAGVIKEFSEKTFIIAITNQGTTDPVIEATAYGAYEIIHRPLKKEIVSKLLKELQDVREEIKHHIDITKSPFSIAPTCAIVGHSPLIMDVCKRMTRLANVEVPVLITGETGTGKELIAESIAQLSPRFGKPFVVINCAAIPDDLLESEFFGYEKGAFTGAHSSKEGMLKIADEGCVFFDEIGELPLLLQGKLLRFIQTQTFYPLGSTKEVQVNVRVISATNRDLVKMVREGKFREDLYHRLSVTTIQIPPLCDRKKDILPLIHFFIHRYRHTAPKTVKGITRDFLNKLLSHDWPGNIRELENTIRSAFALSKSQYLTKYELKDIGTHTAEKKETVLFANFSSDLFPFIKGMLERKEKNILDKVHFEVNKRVFEYMLNYTKNNLSEAARLLGINRLTLRKKLGI